MILVDNSFRFWWIHYWKSPNVYKHAIVPSKKLYFRPGLTWSLRTSSRLTVRVMPSRCIFGSKGPAILVPNNDADNLLVLLAITNSFAFLSLVEVQLAAADAAARVSVHPPGSVGVSPAEMAAKMAALPRKSGGE